MDCLIRVSDIRDDLNEVMEHSSRHAGIAGTGTFFWDLVGTSWSVIGLNAADSVDNLKEHAEVASQLYDQIMKEYPTLTPMIESSLGQGLALMRQKCRYQYSAQHNHFF